MLSRRLIFTIAAAMLAAFSGWKLGVITPVEAQQENAPAGGTPVIKAEARLVLVDTIVTDKKGNYIDDLKQENFKVQEDGKDQQIKSFSFEQNPAGGDNQKRYLVLFFDNSTMDLSDQARARQAAAKFIEANAGPNRLIAVADFGGSVRISQNFTSDAERLKKVVAGLKMSAVDPNAPSSAPVTVASLGTPPIPSAEADFGAHTA